PKPLALSHEGCSPIWIFLAHSSDEVTQASDRSWGRLAFFRDSRAWVADAQLAYDKAIASLISDQNARGWPFGKTLNFRHTNRRRCRDARVDGGGRAMPRNRNPVIRACPPCAAPR